MKSTNCGLLILCIAVFVFLFSGLATAELVQHAGLPNEEGVKPNPMDPKLEHPELPERRGLKVDPAIVHAAFQTQVQLDTNVFLENEDEKFDVITTLTPSVGLELPVGDNYFSADYDIAFNIFGVYNDHNYIDHKVRGVGVVNWTDFQFTLADVYRYFSDRAGSEDTNRVKRQNNYLRAGAATTGFEQLEIESGYTFGVEDFIADDLIYTSPTTGDTLTYHDKDRLVNVIDLAAKYKIMPKTTVLLESFLGWLTYHSSKSSDSWFTETVLGVIGELTDKMTSTLRGGVRYQYYYDSDLTNSSDYLGPVVSGTLNYKYTKDDVYELRLERSVFESTFYNMNYYEVNHAGLRYTHFFNKKLSGRAHGYYQLNLYPSETTVDGTTDTRHDHLFGGGVGIRYDIQEWLSFDVSYEYRQRESVFGTYDYVDNLVTFVGTIGF